MTFLIYFALGYAVAFAFSHTLYHIVKATKKK